MQTRTILVTIVEPSERLPLGIWTSSYEAGRVGDTGVTTINFVRPESYESANLRLIFEVGFNDPIYVDLGQSNTFTLTAAQTKATQFKLQIALTDGSGTVTKSNKLTFYLTSSVLTSNGCSHPDYVQELLQFALSQKVSMTRVVQNVPDPQDLSTSTFSLLGFNHLGDEIINIVIPFKEAYELYSGEGSSGEGGVSSADKVSYNNTLVNPDNLGTLPPQLTATNVQDALDQVLTRIFNIDTSGSAQLAQKVTELDAKVTELTTQIDSINETVTNLNNTLTEIQTQVQSLEDFKSTTTTTLTELNTSVTNLSNQLSDQTKSITDVQTEVTELDNSKLSLTGGQLTGSLVASALDTNTSQVRNMIIYPSGTDVSTIEVPPAGTLVGIMEE